MQLGDIRRVLEADVCSRGYQPDLIVAGGSAADLMSDVLTYARAGAVLLTGLINPQVVRTAEVAAIAAIVFVRGKIPPEETIRLAEENGLPLLTTQLTLFEACGRLYAAGLRSRHGAIEDEQTPSRTESPVGLAD